MSGLIVFGTRSVSPGGGEIGSPPLRRRRDCTTGPPLPNCDDFHGVRGDNTSGSPLHSVGVLVADVVCRFEELAKGFPKIIETVRGLIIRSHYDLHEDF